MTCFVVLFALVMAACAIGGNLQLVHRNRRRVEDDLRRRGLRDIIVTPRWLSGERGTFSYDVRYRDAAGALRTTHCLIPHQLFRPATTIYWAAEPPQRQ
ncbi:MAG TPA: hypothetical protein VGE07_02700 [Herpetosiphonaceae bacterium]